MRNKTLFKIVVYLMIASMLLSTILLTATSFY
ncbi:stressosome-associated protein Prli42 [Paenibacillus mucilaginosus]|nr:stressosome-associated protein Prli42 [Paenibacillus mucilaginosus]MCG7211319.1 stressosome-associated protein Prli42 [Paenibacillus mucilaginosus]WDM30291.1 stressosome-associated protein Prli42 [Paenibacillus mucilaginosus]